MRTPDIRDEFETASDIAAEALREIREGRDLFRFETFGNEGFWTDAMRLPRGLIASKLTPRQALQLGLSIDVTALDPKTRAAIESELKGQSDSSRWPNLNDPLNDPRLTLTLLNANAFIGLVVKDSNGDGRLALTAGDKLGVSCALCHGDTNGVVLRIRNGGSIGNRRGGLAAHSLDAGGLFALAANSRALYPLLQLSLETREGHSYGRAKTGLTAKSTEAEVDAYLSNKKLYPVGMFDDSLDGNGNPVHNMPLFRQDLAFPYGSGGSVSQLENYSNLYYTGILDPTQITTAGGRAYLARLLGAAAGGELADNYLRVLADTGVKGYPYVQGTPARTPSERGTERYPMGIRVDEKKLSALNAYLFKLEAPDGARPGEAAIERGASVFRKAGCVECHKSDPSLAVPGFIVPMNRIFPGDKPEVLLQRAAPLNPILDTPGETFDDKMAVVNASQRGQERGVAIPLLLDLARKPVFLHDDSVATLELLLDPRRGRLAPHPFPVANASERADLVAFLKSLDTRD